MCYWAALNFSSGFIKFMNFIELGKKIVLVRCASDSSDIFS